MHAKTLSTVYLSIVLGSIFIGAGPAQDRVIPNPLWQGQGLQACGDEGREEREYKFTIQGTGLGQLNGGSRLAAEIRQALEKNINAAKWQVPKLVSDSYALDVDPADPVFVDIYYDTPNRLNYEHDVSYRFRMRFGNVDRIQNFVKKSIDERDQPRRMEYQAKVDRKWESRVGFSTVMESRCEGAPAPADSRNPSCFVFVLPSLPKDPKPLDLKPFLDNAETGVLETGGKSCLLRPAQAIVRFFEYKGMPKPALAFTPTLVLETERRRDHLNIDAKLGGEARQAFIITVDTARIYPADVYLPWLRREVTDKPHPLSATINEVEVEFDRSTAGTLNRQIQAAKGDKKDSLTKLRKAFLADQTILMELLKQHFEEISKKNQPGFLNLVPGDRSKYRQARDLLSR